MPAPEGANRAKTALEKAQSLIETLCYAEFMRLVGGGLLVWLVAACGFPRTSTSGAPAPSDAGGSGGTGGSVEGSTSGGTLGGGTNGSAGLGGIGPSSAAPLVPSEYWVRFGSLGSRVHVRIVSPTEAIVDSGRYAIERNDTALGMAAASGGGPSPSGPVVLRASPPSNWLDSIATTADPDGKLGTHALLSLGSRSSQGCLEPAMVTWQTVEGSVEPDVIETEVPATPSDYALLPWGSFSIDASKPARDLLSKDTHARVGEQPIEITWSAQSTTTQQAYGRVLDWLLLVGKQLDVSGTLVNTNGAGPGGFTQWSASFEFLDFGPSRSGQLDFRQGVPADLTLRGPSQVLADDLACATEESPQARHCLRLDAGSRLALRLAGPLVGLRFDLRVENGGPLEGAPTPALPTITFAAVDGTFVSGAPSGPVLPAPVEDVFALVDVPAESNAQVDPACAVAVKASVYIAAIEPLP